MKTRIMPLLAIAALVVPAAALSAEPPKRGLTESQVRSQLGAPNSTRGPVGTPAITRWNYNGFTVYFENGISLHTVVDRPAQQAPQVVSDTTVLPPIEEKEVQAAPEQTTPQPSSAPAAEGEMAFDPITGRFISAEDSAATDTPEKPEAEAPVEPVAAEQPQAEPEQAAEEATTETVASPEQEPEPAPAPAPAPEAAPAPQAEPTPAPAATPPAEPANDSEFRFDPVTGRIIIAGQETPEEAAARAETEATLVKAKEEAAKASAEEAVADRKAEAEAKVNNTKKEAESSVKEAAEEASEAVDEAAEEAEEDGGFYIDWGARQ